MKYEYKLITRLAIAFSIQPIFFYFIFSWLSILLTFGLLKIFFSSIILNFSDKFLLINNIKFNFVDACVASSAYYLLSLLILTTKDINLKKSISMFILGSFLILIFNVFRISLLTLILIHYGYQTFEAIHLTFWLIVASIYVFMLWLFLTHIFKVNSIPVYSDLLYLFKKTRIKK